MYSLKAVNYAAARQLLTIVLDGLTVGSRIGSPVSVVQMSSASLDDENSFTDPTNVVPTHYHVQPNDTAVLVLDLPAFSITVVTAHIDTQQQQQGQVMAS